MKRLGRGHLDSCVDLDGHAVVSGYYQFLDFGGVERFEARVAGRRVPVLAEQLGLDSPDIAALPHCTELPRAAHCRFHVHLGIDPRDIPQHSLIELNPVTRHGVGVALRLVFAPRTPRPAPSAIEVVGGGYESVAHEFLSSMIDVAGLRPDARVLDLGCGIGRMAFGLSAYLEGGSYLGLDIMRESLEIARATFAGDPRFAFELLDVHNGWYNPNGSVPVRGVQLRRHLDDSCDFVLMSSVLTHLFPADAEHYLRECRDVMSGNGTLLATAWLVDGRTGPLVRAGRSAIAFHDKGGYWIESDHNPEGALAHDAEFLLGAIERAGLRVERLIPGFWSGTSNGFAFQDLLVLRPVG
ncbi:MAG: methyltransferase [Planctomycetes bacterium]|nr:methyltransferase [Planctomycetota bacterium]